MNRLSVWEKGEKIARREKGKAFSFPLLAIFSPHPETEGLFTGGWRRAKKSREKFEKDSNSLTFQQFDSRNLIIPNVPLACENILVSSLFAAGDVSRETSPSTKSEEKRMFSQVNCLRMTAKRWQRSNVPLSLTFQQFDSRNLIITNVQQVCARGS